MTRNDMIHKIEDYLLTEHNHVNTSRFIDKDWIEILETCLQLLKEKNN